MAVLIDGTGNLVVPIRSSRETDLKADAIAAQTGFAERSYLQEALKKLHGENRGISPECAVRDDFLRLLLRENIAFSRDVALPLGTPAGERHFTLSGESRQDDSHDRTDLRISGRRSEADDLESHLPRFGARRKNPHADMTSSLRGRRRIEHDIAVCVHRCGGHGAVFVIELALPFFFLFGFFFQVLFALFELVVWLWQFLILFVWVWVLRVARSLLRLRLPGSLELFRT